MHAVTASSTSLLRVWLDDCLVADNDERQSKPRSRAFLGVISSTGDRAGKLILGLRLGLVLIFVTIVGSRAVLLSPLPRCGLASRARHVGPAYTGRLFDLCFREAAVSACELLGHCND